MKVTTGVSHPKIRELWTTEDWWAVWLSIIVFLFTPLSLRIPVPHAWTYNPLVSLSDLAVPLLLLWMGLSLLVGVSLSAMRERVINFSVTFPIVFGLAALSYLISSQVIMKSYGLGYAFWALLLGLLVSNTVGTPKWLLPAVRSELYIKIGLVLLGGEILFSKLLSLGARGILVAWIVTPIVLIFMYFAGTKLLKLSSKKLVILIAAATSVCGVSAAIATAGACKAKKEELTLAVGMTLIFTVLMMVFMPMAIKAVGMDPIVGGAWMGGTIDSTGAVVAAGDMLGKDALSVAAVIKMIQNILIGFLAFVVAVLWVTRVERDISRPKPTPIEIWYRFPKFIVGFLAASLVFSFILTPILGEAAVANLLETSKGLRGYFFCLAFISIGLESNFKNLAKQVVGGKPILLYLLGQSFNLALTLLVAWLVFGGILF